MGILIQELSIHISKAQYKSIPHHSKPPLKYITLNTGPKLDRQPPALLPLSRRLCNTSVASFATRTSHPFRGALSTAAHWATENRHHLPREGGAASPASHLYRPPSSRFAYVSFLKFEKLISLKTPFASSF